MYNRNIIKKRSALTLLHATSTVKVVVVYICLFITRTTLLLPTARGGFLLVDYVFTKDICCTFSHNTSHNFTKDFKKCFHDYHKRKEERRPTTLTIFQIYNLSTFDKIQKMTGSPNTNYADFLLSSLFASFSCCFRKMVAMIGPEMLCHTLKMALGTAASGLK
jgi:hypothetical protein